MYCSRHGRLNCVDFYCRQEARNRRDSSGYPDDNTGSLSVDPTTGDLNVGIGGGLTVDLEDGDLGAQIAPGIALDF